MFNYMFCSYDSVYGTTPIRSRIALQSPDQYFDLGINRSVDPVRSDYFVIYLDDQYCITSIIGNELCLSKKIICKPANKLNR